MNPQQFSGVPGTKTITQVNTTRRTTAPKETFDRLKEAVFARRPIFKEVLAKCGHKSLLEYAHDYFDVNESIGRAAREDEFIGTFRRQVARLLGDRVADSAARQLKKYYFVSTADHHGPICHPFWLSSNLVTAIAMLKRNDPALENVIVLSCANVSLNNSSFPRGLLFRTGANNRPGIETHRLSFLPSNSHSCSVYHFRSYTPDEVKKVKKALNEKVAAGAITPQLAEKKIALLNEIYDHPDIFACKTYSEQVTKTNYALWQRFTRQKRNDTPGLIYLEQESLVIQLLLEHHLAKESTIHQLLFDPRAESLLHRYFEGIMGAFSRQEQSGTYLFWGISHDKNYRIQLWKKGNVLTSGDGAITVPLTPAGLRAAIEEGHIIPSMLLIFIVLALYYGLKCLGGFSQVNYLTDMKRAYIQMQTELGNELDVTVAKAVQTKELGEDLSIAFAGFGDNQLTLATGLDLILYQNPNTWDTLTEVAEQITLDEAFAPMFPDFYQVAYAGPTRDPALLALTPHDITDLLNLERKTRPCVNVC